MLANLPQAIPKSDFSLDMCLIATAVISCDESFMFEFGALKIVLEYGVTNVAVC